jgi:hypothetical protein
MGTEPHSLDVAEWPFEPAPSMCLLPYVLLAAAAAQPSTARWQPTAYRTKLWNVEERAMCDPKAVRVWFGHRCGLSWG